MMGGLSCNLTSVLLGPFPENLRENWILFAILYIFKSMLAHRLCLPVFVKNDIVHE